MRVRGNLQGLLLFLLLGNCSAICSSRSDARNEKGAKISEKVESYFSITYQQNELFEWPLELFCQYHWLTSCTVEANRVKLEGLLLCLLDKFQNRREVLRTYHEILEEPRKKNVYLYEFQHVSKYEK